MKRSRKWRHFAEQGRTAPETARARAQLATDVLLPLAVEVGNIGIFETDLERMVTRFSPELCGILGLPAGTEMTYEEATLLVDERDRAAVRAAVASRGFRQRKMEYRPSGPPCRRDGSMDIGPRTTTLS